MRKNFVSCLLATALAFSSAGVYADEQTEPPTTEQAIEQANEQTTEKAEPREVPATSNTAAPGEDTAVEDTTMASQPREVGAASHDAARAARARKWQNIGIACLAVAVAATAIYLASTNGGHHAKQ